MTISGFRINSNTKTVADILLQGRFQVPWHQREFDWDPEDVEQFWNDIVEAVDHGSEDYFVGSIVLTKRAKGDYQIQDGQQRLVTFSLMCAALSREFEKSYDPDTDARIQEANKILYELSPTVMHNKAELKGSSLRITPAFKNKLNYRLIIQGQRLEPNGKLKRAWQLLQQQCAALKEEDADSILRYLTQNVVAVEIATVLENATRVFETLNDRGKRLEEVDLFRNHLYSHFSTDNDERHQQVHEHLMDLRDQFDGPHAVTKMSEYVRCIMQSRFGFINAKRLNKGASQAIASETKGISDEERKDYIAELVFDLRKGEHIQAFLTIDKGDIDSVLVKDFVSKSGKSQAKRNMREFIAELREYKVTRPVMYAILSQFQEAQGAEKRAKARLGHAIAQTLTSFMMRTSAAADKFSPATVEETLSGWGQRIAVELEKNTLLEFASALVSVDRFRVWSDVDFKGAMTIQRVGPEKAKKVLYPLYKFEQADLSQQKQDHMTLEHILPRSPSWLEGWDRFDSDSQASYHTRLGNLTLMSSSDNKGGDAQNKSFEAKKQILRRSTLVENQKIAECTDWSPQSISERQARLIHLACQVWRFDVN